MSLSVSRKAKEVRPSSTLAITARAKEMQAEGLDVVGFGAGEPDFNTPANIREAAVRAIEEGFTKYTEASGTEELKRAVCRKFERFNHLHYEPEQIVISNGGKHSLTNIFTAIINPGDEVIIPSPYWLSYPEIVKLAGGVPVYVRGYKSNGYKVSAEQIRAAVSDKTKAVIINSPNNPTGMVYTEEELRAIAAVAVECDIYVISDEIYEQLNYDEGGNTVSIASFDKEIYRRTITCSGVSKSYAMTGWRIGYTGSNPELARLMGSIQSHQTSNPNSIAQKAAYEALTGSQEEAIRMGEEFLRRSEYIYRRVSEIPQLSALKPQGAFFLFVDCSRLLHRDYKGIPVESAARITEILLEDYLVAVVPCGDFGFPDHIRLSYAIAQDQIEKGMDRIAEFIQKLE
ncbi:MAG: pyridoxal phosphate-dependent aminotransferase [Lachnospiraceae bacterium]|nr:pyridoxal phosphate-dependent aminotransferase [Lachnospiraceae bacterium]